MTSDIAPMTRAEQSMLAECESKIRSGMQTFMEVGRSLAKIRDARLYRGAHSTFEAYCEKEWQFTRSRAYRIIDAATIIEAMSPMGDIPLPTTERQARELVGLPAETAAEVMRTAESGPSGAPTASTIREARRTIDPRLRPAEPEPITVTETHSTRTECTVEPSTGEVFAVVAGDDRLRQLNFQAAFARDMSRAHKAVLTYNPVEVGELVDPSQLDSLDELARSLTAFAVKARKHRAGFRVVSGGLS